MIDKGAAKLAKGELARKGRALHSIKAILGLDDQEYTAWVEGMTNEERITHHTEVDRYMRLCTIMSAEYLQWSTQLLLESSEVVGGSEQSSFIGPLGAFLLGAIKDGKPLSQHLRNAAEQITEMAKARQRFLDELYDQLRPHERTQFGDLLGACTLPLNSLPDIKLWKTMDWLDLCWKFRHEEMAERLMHLPAHLMYTQIQSLPLRVTQRTEKAASHILEGCKVSDDSLAARLLIASMINRYHQEKLEYERYEATAVSSLLQLVIALRALGLNRIPSELSQDAFKDWLMSAFSGDCFAGEQQWRPLKSVHLSRLYDQAEWILGWERIDFAEHEASESVLLNLCALGLAWSYCTREKHDIKVPDVKDYDLVNLREIESAEQVPLTRIKYQQRQLKILLGCQHQFNPVGMERQTAHNRELRRQQMQFIRSLFRGISLAQCRTLSIRVAEILFPQLSRF
ncbi:hypothetical protein PUN49_20700 [Pseudomonas extremaustralis]|uniref:hypothetical protein n=1 Tax=Pseudomonas extremaustralis TaxID=359110 RepID=UPI00240ECCED|nr:hypothetical protein [Pseudomonas extremaustralis]MDG2969443.1 hypothetical protein [Pseudomonas extremaustralis]